MSGGRIDRQSRERTRRNGLLSFSFFFQRAITFTFLPLSHFGKDTDGPLINDKVGNSTASASSACVLFVMVVVELQRKQKKRTRVLHCCFCCCCCSSCWHTAVPNGATHGSRHDKVTIELETQKKAATVFHEPETTATAQLSLLIEKAKHYEQGWEKCHLLITIGQKSFPFSLSENETLSA